MCATVNKYERKIDKLQKIVYPQISALLEEISCYRNLFDYDTLEENITLLTNEFNSLTSLEEKLIFPAIVAVFNTKESNSHFPNIAEIVQLTASKETKIKKFLASIKEVVAVDKNHYNNDFEKAIVCLLHLFNDAYFPSKIKWTSLLQMLTPESVNCVNRDNGNCKCGDKEEHHHNTENHHHH